MDRASNGSARASSTTGVESPTLSLILPAYNEEKAIAAAVREADRALRDLTEREVLQGYEIVVVDDGGRDRTSEIVSQLQNEHPALRLKRHDANRGYGAALQTGFQAATSDLVAFTDADCQFDLRELDRFLLLSRDYDFVCGYRIDRQDSWPRLFYSKGFNFACRTLLGTGVRDVDCALKVMRRENLCALPLESQGFFINAELLSRAKAAEARIVEVGVTHRPRLLGKSTVSPWQVFPVGKALARFWWRTVAFPTDAEDRTGSDKRWPLATEACAVLFLVAATLIMLLVNLSYPLFEPDELRYGEIAIEMHRSGDWITPRLLGEAYLDKPPLTYWLTASAYGLFGETEAATRFPCVLAGALTVLATFFLGRRLIGDLPAWLGAVSLLLCGGFVISCRFLLLDGPFTLFITVALLSLCIASNGRRFLWRWWLAGAFAAGLACLTKGPAVLVLIAPVLAAYRWLTPDRARIGWQPLAALLGVVVAVTAPWFIAISRAQPDFLEYFFWKHHVVRYVSAFDHEQPWWFYAPILAAALLPATAALPWTAHFLFSRKPADRQRRRPEHGFLLLWATWVVLFFSLSSCKLPAYILPAFPPLALLIGAALAVRWRNEWSSLSEARKANWDIARITLAVIACAALVDWAVLPEPILERFFDPLLATFAAGAYLLVGRLPKLSPRFVWAATAALGYAALLFAACDIVPEIAEQRSVHAAAGKYRREVNSDPASIVYIGRRNFGSRIYLPGEDVRRLDAAEVESLRSLAAERDVIVVTRPDLAASLREQLSTTSKVEAIDNRRDLLMIYRATPLMARARPGSRN